MFPKKRMLLYLLLAVTVVIAACASESESEDATALPEDTTVPTEVEATEIETTEAEPTVAETEEVTAAPVQPTATDEPEVSEATEETIEEATLAVDAQSAEQEANADDEADALVTEEPLVVELDTAATIEVAPDAPNETSDGVYRFSVSRGIDDYQDDAYPVADGQRLFFLELSIQTTGSGTVITPQAIALLDEAGNRYAPVEPTEAVIDDLLNEQVTADQRLSGVVVFALPEDVVPETIAWCPNETCDQPLTQFVRAFSNRQ